MNEHQIENYLCTQVKDKGGLALKLNSTSMAGLPDRLVLFPDGAIYFVELKAPGKKPRPLQAAVHRRLKSLGFMVSVIDSKQQVNEFIEKVGTDGIYTTQVSGNSHK